MRNQKRTSSPHHLPDPSWRLSAALAVVVLWLVIAIAAVSLWQWLAQAASQ
jgi:hypothetical protein